MRRLCILLAAFCFLVAAAAADTMIIPEGTERIEEEAFRGSLFSEDLILPEGLLYIGDYAFADTGVRRVTLPASLTEIGEGAFPEGTVGSGPAGSTAAAWFAAAEGLSFDADYGTAEEADESVWAEARKNQAWYVSGSGELHAGDLSALCACWLNGEGAEAGENETESTGADEASVLNVYLCRNETMLIENIARKDINRFLFLVDTEALPELKSAVAAVEEILPEGSESSGDENEIISFQVKLQTPKKKSGGGGSYIGGNTVRIVHVREKNQADHGYDQLSFADLSDGITEAMSVLTLSGEEQSLKLTRGEEDAYFLPALLSWEPLNPEQQTGEEPDPPADPAAADEKELNTLLLETTDLLPETSGDASESPADPAAQENDSPWEWTFGGDLLRKLNRTGITWLALKAGDQIAVFPAEGFLAGEEYDALKSAGTASRRFIYTVSMSRPAEPGSPDFDPEDSVAVSVTVQDTSYLLTQNDNALLYMEDVLVLPGAAMQLILENSSK